jgi:copper resistance protein C
MMRQFPDPRRWAVLAAVGFALLLLPSTVTAHAELETSTPEDGATVEGTPTEVVGTYSEAMSADGSSLRLVDAGGTVVARGDVDPDDAKRMVITDLPDLAPGTYTVQSTTRSAEDGDVDREEWSFTVVAAPTPSPSPTPTPTPAPSATPAPSPTPAPSLTPAPTAAPTPIASADGTNTSAGVGDVLLPIVAAIVIVAIVAGYLYSRRDRPPTQT